MDKPSHNAPRPDVWLPADAGDIADFNGLIARETQSLDAPQASEITKNIPIYDASLVSAAASQKDTRHALLAEWNTVFDTGPGVLAIRNALAPETVDRATSLFEALIAKEKEEGTGAGDHFAKPGANDRVWNAAQKHCLADPENFADYYSNDTVAMAAAAWLGRGSQLTAQVNRVNPGGAAQTAHRDYHLGFMTAEQLATYPVQAHLLSPSLTLQGAIAHCDMPVETGPTMLLPYSQQFKEGYIAFNRPEFQEAFTQHHVQLPLAKGDALFFNPALMHAAGNNMTTNTQRMANLLQISSAFGRSIESVDRSAMVRALYPILLNSHLTPREKSNVVAASAEGYAFPTNLDRDPPVGGLIPGSVAERMEAALAENMSIEDFNTMIDARDLARAP